MFYFRQLFLQLPLRHILATVVDITALGIKHRMAIVVDITVLGVK